VKDLAVGAVSITYREAVPLDPKAGSALRETTSAIASRVRLALTPERKHWFPDPS
jgi:hypothetical protein